MHKIKDKLINGEKDHKSFKELFIDAFKFTFNKPIILLVLGLFLFITSVMNDIVKSFNNPKDFILIIILLIVSIILAIYEFGYAYLIFEKSTEGFSTPPSLFNYKEILHHGIKDFVVVFIYVLLMVVIQTFIKFLQLPFLQFSLPLNYFPFFLEILSSFIGGICILFIYVTLINIAFNKGKLKSAFNFKEIFKIIYNVGLLRLIVILFIIDLADFLMVHSTDLFHDWIFFVMNIFIIFIVTPALLLFSERLIIMSAIH